MSQQEHESERGQQDEAPGQNFAGGSSVGKYFAGLCLSLVLTLASFWVAGTDAVWQQAVPTLLASLAIAQMGIHLVFFLHLSSGPEGVNNILALAFGVFVVGLIVFGSMADSKQPFHDGYRRFVNRICFVRAAAGVESVGRAGLDSRSDRNHRLLHSPLGFWRVGIGHSPGHRRAGSRHPGGRSQEVRIDLPRRHRHRFASDKFWKRRRHDLLNLW